MMVRKQELHRIVTILRTKSNQAPFRVTRRGIEPRHPLARQTEWSGGRMLTCSADCPGSNPRWGAQEFSKLTYISRNYQLFVT